MKTKTDVEARMAIEAQILDLRTQAEALEAQIGRQHVALAEAHAGKKLREMVGVVSKWSLLKPAPGSSVEDLAAVFVRIEAACPDAFKVITQQCAAWQAQRELAARWSAGSDVVQ
jgi:hypothetical protein